eukprot:10594085-Alexandrium_andersonii.AAC.1
MSASLVGSEMCIRDSPRLVTPARQRRSRSRCRRQSGCPQRWGGGRQDPCLLYTSDAADDM